MPQTNEQKDKETLLNIIEAIKKVNELIRSLEDNDIYEMMNAHFLDGMPIYEAEKQLKKLLANQPTK